MTSFWRGTIFGTVSVVCLVGGSVKHFSRNGKVIGTPTKTLVHVAVAENIWQQGRELVDNLALMRRFLTGSQKTKTSLTEFETSSRTCVGSASGESLLDYICRNCSDRNGTLAKRVFKLRENLSETREKLGSTCVKRLTKLSDEKQIDGPTRKSVNIEATSFIYSTAIPTKSIEIVNE